MEVMRRKVRAGDTVLAHDAWGLLSGHSYLVSFLSSESFLLLLWARPTSHRSKPGLWTASLWPSRGIDGEGPRG